MTEGGNVDPEAATLREGSCLPRILEDMGSGSRVGKQSAAKVRRQHLLPRNKETNLLLSTLEQK